MQQTALVPFVSQAAVQHNQWNFLMVGNVEKGSCDMITVLVIEDDRSVRETLGIVLETYEYKADLVEGGEEALAYLQKTWPDVILLDLTLNGMSGEEVYEKIQKGFGHVPPTVVLSAVPHAEDRTRKMAGVRFLAKPYTLDQLIHVIRDAATSKTAA